MVIQLNTPTNTEVSKWERGEMPTALTFKFSRNYLHTIFGEMEGVGFCDLCTDYLHYPVLLCLGEKSHASGAEDVEQGVLMVRGRNMRESKLKQGLDGGECSLWTLAKGSYTWRYNRVP